MKILVASLLDWKRKTHRELSMDEIRSKFGSQTVQGKQYAALTA